MNLRSNLFGITLSTSLQGCGKSHARDGERDCTNCIISHLLGTLQNSVQNVDKKGGKTYNSFVHSSKKDPVSVAILDYKIPGKNIEMNVSNNIRRNLNGCFFVRWQDKWQKMESLIPHGGPKVLSRCCSLVVVVVPVPILSY